MDSGIIQITPTEFRQDFPEFSNTEDYPDSTIHTFIRRAYCMISPRNYGAMRGDCRKFAIELVVAHMLTMASKLASQGKVSAHGFVQSASIGEVSVNIVAPNNRNSLEYWFNQTPYGQQYLAYLRSFMPIGKVTSVTPNRVFRGNVV